MIARIWHGRTKKDKGDEYLKFLLERALPDYKEKDGNLGAYIFKEDQVMMNAISLPLVTGIIMDQ